MSVQAGKLKHPSGWFAAGREVSRALTLLSDGAFRLFIYLCLNANRRTGQVNITSESLAEAMDRSSDSISSYLEELKRQNVCQVQNTASQRGSSQIEISDAFWPYEKAQTEPVQQNREGYVTQIRQLMATRRCVAISFGAADENLAGALFQRRVPIQQVERGFLLGCARKYATLLNNNTNEPIVSFSYFQNTIEEVGEQQVSEDYWCYLRLRVDQMEKKWSCRRTT